MRRARPPRRGRIGTSIDSVVNISQNEFKLLFLLCFMLFCVAPQRKSFQVGNGYIERDPGSTSRVRIRTRRTIGAV
jgi:hypothetical protein